VHACMCIHACMQVSFLEGLAVQRVEGEDAGEARLGDAELNGEVNHRSHPNGENRKLNGELNAEAASPSTCPSSPRVQGTPSESTAKVAAPSEVAAPSHDVCVCAYEPQAADDVAGYRGQGTESQTDDAAAAGPARTQLHSKPASTSGESVGKSAGDKSVMAQLERCPSPLYLRFSRWDLAHRRTQTVESAACQWEMQIESLIATHPASTFVSHDSCRWEDTDGEEDLTRACGAHQDFLDHPVGP